MRRVLATLWESLSDGATWLWSTEVLQNTMRELLTLLHRALQWVGQHPGSIVGGFLAYFLWGLVASVSTTSLLFNALGVPLWLVTILVVLLGVLIGGGAIEVKKRPYDDR